MSKIETHFLGCEGNRLVASHFTPQRPVDAPPVVLMHGGGQTRHSWNGAARKLAARGFDAFTVDARGHGESDWVDSSNYAFSAFRDDLRAIAGAVTERFGTAPILIGASMGGISAMLGQADRGAAAPLFSAIVLVDITPRMASSGVDKIITFMAAKMRDGFASIEEAAEAVALYMPNRHRPKSLDGLKKNLRQRTDQRWYWHWDPAFVDGPAPITTRSSASLDMLQKAARQISVPTLLVRGGKSELVTQEAAQEFLELVPHARYVDVTDAGHMVAGDKNDIFADAVIGFLEDQLHALQAG